jgi:fructokinase
MGLGMERADIARLSLDGMELLTGTRDPSAGTEKLWAVEPPQSRGMRLIIITMGREGCAYRTAEGFGRVPGYTAHTVDTYGAGDGFLAGLLAELIQTASADHEGQLAEFGFSQNNIERSLRFANAVGAMMTTRHGTIPGLPTRSHVQTFVCNSPNHP